MKEPVCLVGQPFHNAFRCVAQIAHGDAGKKIEIPSSVHIPEPAAFASCHDNRKSRICIRQIRLCFFNQLFLHHSPPEICVPIPESVSTSRRSACATLPSMICVF